MKIGRQVCLFYIFSRQVIGRILCGIGGQKRTGGIYEEDCQQQDAGASYFPAGVSVLYSAISFILCTMADFSPLRVESGERKAF